MPTDCPPPFFLNQCICLTTVASYPVCPLQPDQVFLLRNIWKFFPTLPHTGNSLPKMHERRISEHTLSEYLFELLFNSVMFFTWFFYQLSYPWLIITWMGTECIKVASISSSTSLDQTFTLYIWMSLIDLDTSMDQWATRYVSTGWYCFWLLF